MGFCYLMKIALQAWFTNGFLLSTEDSIAGRVLQMGLCYLLKIALQAGFTNGLLLSTEDGIAGRFYKCVAAIY